jgi:hypothetical protein
MNLKTNSLNAKLYCWFYGKPTYQLPSNLCPYFWKLVLAWVLVVPYSLFCTLYILTHEIFNKKYENGDHNTGERIGVSVLVNGIVFILFLMINFVVWFFVDYDPKSIFTVLLRPGAMFWTVAILVGGYYGIKALIEYIKESRIPRDENGYRIYPEYKEKKPNLIVEFVKAKYGKYCPKIDWEGNGK